MRRSMVDAPGGPPWLTEIGHEIGRPDRLRRAGAERWAGSAMSRPNSTADKTFVGTTSMGWPMMGCDVPVPPPYADPPILRPNCS
jgi:hypothetical protein